MPDATPSAPAAETPRFEPPFSRALPWVSLISGVFFVSYLSRAIFGPLLPYIEREFSIAHDEATRIIFMMSCGYSLSLFFSGYTLSRFRPKLLVSLSLVVGGLAMAACASIKNFTLFTVVFILIGAASGHYFNSGLTALRSLVTPSQWSKAVAIHQIAPNACFLICPILAERLTRWLGWDGAVAVIGWGMVGVGALFYVFGRGGEQPAMRVSLKGVGVMLRSPKLWLYVWLTGIAIAGEFAPYSVLTLHMVEDRGFSLDAAANLLSFSRIASPFAVLLSGFIVARLGTRRALLALLTGYAAGVFLMAMPWNAALVVGMFTQPVLSAMVIPANFTLLAESFPAKEQPMLLAVGQPVGSFIGVGVMPYLLGICGVKLSFAAGFALMGCLVGLSLVLVTAAMTRKNAVSV